MDQMTKAQAIENGYTYAQCEDDFRKIEEVENDRLLADEWSVSSKETSQRSYTSSELFELVSDHVECDDRFYDEDAVATELMKGEVDWDLFASQINEALSVLKYHMPTSIRLVP